MAHALSHGQWRVIVTTISQYRICNSMTMYIIVILSLQKDLQNLEDAGDELMLADDDQPIPYPTPW